MAFMLMMSLMIIFFLTTSNNPLIIMITLIFLSVLIAFISGYSFSKWITFTIILIFLGGMMVMFLYICSISLNSLISWKIYFIFSLPLLLILFKSNSLEFFTHNPYSHLKLMFLKSWGELLLILIMYLLSILTTTVKISQNFKGAISKKW